MTLSGVATQSLADVHVIVSDQSDQPVAESPTVRALDRVIAARGGTSEWHYRVPSKGIAEQRQFLLDRSSSPTVLYLDDDVLMEPWVLEQLCAVLEEQQCGFVGAFPAGLSFRDDVRPSQQAIEYWEGRVGPETVEPGSPQWERWHLHRAANLHHVSLALPSGTRRVYKVAWVASCILYDRRKLAEVGGFLGPPASLSLGRGGRRAEPVDAAVGRVRDGALGHLLR
jgi:hypothetical protein